MSGGFGVCVQKKRKHFGRRQKFHQCSRTVSFRSKRKNNLFVFRHNRCGHKRIWRQAFGKLANLRDSAKSICVQCHLNLSLFLELICNLNIWLKNHGNHKQRHLIRTDSNGMKYYTINKFYYAVVQRSERRPKIKSAQIFFRAITLSVMCARESDMIK